MIITCIARVDMENNAETFWDNFREAVGGLDHHSELAINCSRILERGEVELLDSNAISEFQEFVCEIEGFSEGPSHAADAILFCEE